MRGERRSEGDADHATDNREQSCERFLEDMDTVDLASKQDEIYDTIDLLPVVPVLGSRNLPESIVEEFGENVRKLVVDPVLVIYELVEEDDVMLIHALIYGKAAR